MRGVFEGYGYQEVETPIFEHLELFTRKVGEEVVKQLYTFQDKSGRWLVLRPELTAPVVRVYVTQLKSAPKPLKLFYFGPCFRYEEPQAKRWRQFLQAGAEILGSSKPQADAEVIALAKGVIQRLGLRRSELRVGHVRLLREVLARAGVKGDAQDPVMRAIDSRNEARLKEELDRAGVKLEDGELLRALISLKGGAGVLEEGRELVKGLAGAEQAIRNLGEILEKLELLGVEDFEVDLSIARGLEYYTDAVFEVYVDGVQVAGGGRYDELVELLGGESCPAVGVGFGVDRLARALLDQGVRVPKGRLNCMVLPAGVELLDESLRIAQELRSSGLSADVDLMDRSLAKAMAYAGSRGAEFVVIVGSKDLEAGEVTLRDMRTGEQERVKRAEVASRLRLKLIQT